MWQKETRRVDNFFAFGETFISPAIDELNVEVQTTRVGGTAFEQARLRLFWPRCFNFNENTFAEFLGRYVTVLLFPADKTVWLSSGVMVDGTHPEIHELCFVNNLKLLLLMVKWVTTVEYCSYYGYLSTYHYPATVINATSRTPYGTRYQLDFTGRWPIMPCWPEAPCSTQAVFRVRRFQ